MKKSVVARLVLALMVGGIVSMPMGVRAQGDEPLNLMVVNPGSNSFGLRWVITVNVTGYINWGE